MKPVIVTLIRHQLKFMILVFGVVHLTSVLQVFFILNFDAWCPWVVVFHAGTLFYSFNIVLCGSGSISLSEWRLLVEEVPLARRHGFAQVCLTFDLRFVLFPILANTGVIEMVRLPLRYAWWLLAYRPRICAWIVFLNMAERSNTAAVI